MAFPGVMASSRIICSAYPSPTKPNLLSPDARPLSQNTRCSISLTNFVHRHRLTTYASASSVSDGQDREETKSGQITKSKESVPQRRRNGRGTATRALSPFGDTDWVFPTSRSLESLLDLVDRFFDEPYYAPGVLTRALQDVIPSASIRSPWDVVEQDEAYYLRLDMPGFSKDQVKVSVDDGDLIIKAERSMDDKSDKFVARNASNISSKLLLPDNVEVENISAELKNGVLLVTVPKTSKKQNGVVDIHIN